MIDIEMKDDLFREAYFDKFLSLKNIFTKELPELIYSPKYTFENGKTISRLYLELPNVSIHNKDTWPEIYDFFNRNMGKLESLFIEYQDYIKDV